MSCLPRRFENGVAPRPPLPTPVGFAARAVTGAEVEPTTVERRADENAARLGSPADRSELPHARPRDQRADRRRAAPPARDAVPDPVREPRLARRAGRERLGPDRQVLRGLSRPALLPGQRASSTASSGWRRGAREALFGVEHANVQPLSGAPGQPRGLRGVPGARRHRPRDVA